jgi:hypothetical protein
VRERGGEVVHKLIKVESKSKKFEGREVIGFEIETASEV